MDDACMVVFTITWSLTIAFLSTLVEICVVVAKKIGGSKNTAREWGFFKTFLMFQNYSLFHHLPYDVVVVT